MDVIETLKAQHNDLEDLFHDLSVAHGAERRARIFEELSSALVAHIGLEERVLRYAVSRAQRDSGLLESWEARLRVERVITALAAMDVSHERFGADLERLQELVESRVEHEEVDLFPKLQKVLYVGTARTARRAATSHRSRRAVAPAPAIAMGGRS